MTQDHTQFMQRALELATESAQKGTGPFGCVVVKEGKIIAEAHNQVTELKDPTAHAEVQAIRKACQVLDDFQLTGCTLYSSCLPCPQCFGAIYWARPDKVYYCNTADEAAQIGFDDAFIYQELENFTQSKNHENKMLSRLTVTEPLRAFEAWSNNSQKTEY